MLVQGSVFAGQDLLLKPRVTAGKLNNTKSLLRSSLMGSTYCGRAATGARLEAAVLVRVRDALREAKLVVNEHPVCLIEWWV